MGFMKQFLSRLFDLPWYPIAIGTYPVLALLSANAGQVRLVEGLRSLLFALIFGACLIFLAWALYREIHKASFLAAIGIVLFFSYGHAYIAVLEEFPEAGYEAWIAPAWLALFGITWYWTSRPALTFRSAAPSLNTVGLALVVMASWGLLSSGIPSSVHALGADHAPVQTDLILPENPPDIYYFVLDSYGRADLLDLVYGHDNSGFLESLAARGFFVAECSQSNYTRTELSMASSLNMMYLQDLDDEFEPQSIARRTLWRSLKHGAVRYNLESLGYQTVSFPTGYPWGELEDADLFLIPPPISSGLNEFEALLMRTTALYQVQDWGIVDPEAILAQRSRDLFHNVFDHIPQVAGLPGPQFVYIHIIPPHPPFVFDAQGNPTYPPDFWNEQRKYPYDLYAKGYVDQTIYLNSMMLEAVDAILEGSETPPVILIQGDHGPWMQPKDRHMWILNAYYLPGHADGLYSTISPVNSFRLVFNAYFGGEYDMLEDVSYYSPVPKLYEFTEIPNQCGNK